jgi:outer membrane protein TolC
LKLIVTHLFLAAAALAEPRTLTLRQTVALALEQNPEVMLARLDEQKALLEVRAVQEPVLPKLVAGSGLAYTYGMPMSVEGSAPTIVQVRAIRSLWDPSRGYLVAKAKEDARGSGIDASIVREDVALKTAILYLDLERAQRAVETVRRQVEHLQRIEAAVRLRIEEGRQLPLDGKRAAVNLAQARRRLSALETTVEAHSLALSQALGLDPKTGVRAAMEEREGLALPSGEEEAVAAALGSNKDVRRLESALAAKNLEARAHRAGRWPRIDLIAQYGLLSKFNNYEDYFNRFQRHNAQLGASFQIPVFGDRVSATRAAQAELEARRLGVQTRQTRSRVESDTRGAWQRLKDAEAGRDLARMDLDLAREQVTVLLAQLEEGRATMQQLEQARFEEQEKWLALYDAAALVERSRLNLLRQTESLSAALR